MHILYYFTPEESIADIRSSPLQSRETLRLVGCYFLRCSRLLGLPQVAVDGDGVHAGGHGLSRDLAKLLPVRIILKEAVDHLPRDALGPDASQLVHLLRFGAVRVDGAELAARIAEQDQEVVGLRFLHLLQKEEYNTRLQHCMIRDTHLKDKSHP